MIVDAQLKTKILSKEKFLNRNDIIRNYIYNNSILFSFVISRQYKEVVVDDVSELIKLKFKLKE